MKTRQNNGGILAGAILVAVFAAILSSVVVWGDPAGATVSNPATDTGPTISPDSRADGEGTITTLLLTSVGQTAFWKAYVGNVSGSLTLDDSQNYTIYAWDLGGSITGEVFASRNSSLDWTSASCASPALVDAESAFFGMAGGQDLAYDINSTFNYTVHDAMQIGGTVLGADSCNMTVTFVNDTRRAATAGADFQELLVTDASANSLVFATTIDDDGLGYNEEQFDFQFIVPESATNVTPAAYYFYVELG